jgi:hypothetical protein
MKTTTKGKAAAKAKLIGDESGDEEVPLPKKKPLKAAAQEKKVLSDAVCSSIPS